MNYLTLVVVSRKGIVAKQNAAWFGTGLRQSRQHVCVCVFRCAPFARLLSAHVWPWLPVLVVEEAAVAWEALCQQQRPPTAPS